MDKYWLAPHEEVLYVDSGQSQSKRVAARWPIERRAQPRVFSDEITLTFLGAHHPAVNWSKIGFLVADSHPNLPIGTKVTGFVGIRGREGLFRFTAQLIRHDVPAGQAAFCFEQLSSQLQDALSSAAERAANPHAFDQVTRGVIEGDTVQGDSRRG